MKFFDSLLYRRRESSDRFLSAGQSHHIRPLDTAHSSLLELENKIPAGCVGCRLDCRAAYRFPGCRARHIVPSSLRSYFSLALLRFFQDVCHCVHYSDIPCHQKKGFDFPMQSSSDIKHLETLTGRRQIREHIRSVLHRETPVPEGVVSNCQPRRLF